ncbi:serine protease [Allgaiera indica]|uniref:Probable periplasmic serine endoprotease DegP-like n=1 Tax=Allgaiera indica TaxID=765699 RepID=A0AAN4UUM3_9RHOB|nr:serine protease [Allgaiera indica]SDX62665.1 serine protease Do [Allgaiera indica]
MQSKAYPRLAPDPARAWVVAQWVTALVLGLALLFAQALSAQARGTPEGFADLVAKVSPAVVDITTSTMVAASADNAPIVPKGSPFEDFFNNFMDQNGKQRPRRSQALGSGFVISEDGYIVTNNHVIEGADDIRVEFKDGDHYEAKVIGTDPKTDIALLKIKADKPLPFVSFGNSDDVRVGDWVLAVGNPLGQGFSVSAGIISARNRALSGTYDDYFQTDAAINRGNSGGPLFDMGGKVIGVNTAILSPNGGSIGIGFSMASNVVVKVVDQLRKYGETRRGWLGVRIQNVTSDMAEAMGLPKAAGALVTDVPEGPAKKGGIKPGDVIQRFNGKEVADTRDLVRMVADANEDQVVPIVVFRDGKTMTLDVKLGRRESAEQDSGAAKKPTKAPEPAETKALGMTLSPLTAELRDKMGLTPDMQGIVIVGLDESSEAYAKGLREGDLITEAGQAPVASIADFKNRIDEARRAGRKSLLVLIRRNGEPRFVALSVGK